MNKWKKVFAVFLTAVLTASLLSAVAFAQESVPSEQEETVRTEDVQAADDAPAPGETETAEIEEVSVQTVESSAEETAVLSDETVSAAEETEAEPEDVLPEDPELTEGKETASDRTEEEQETAEAAEKNDSEEKKDEKPEIEPEEETTDIEPAADGVESGVIGDNITWILDEDGVLTISGSGKVESAPYCRGSVSEIIITEGITILFNDEYDDPTFGFYKAYETLEKVTLPDSLTDIGANAFSGCQNLKEVVGGNGLKTIKPYAFNLCQSLRTIDLNDGITEIGECAFYGCALAGVHFPASMTKISKNAFTRNAFTAIEIPDTITEIDEYAFWDNEALTSVSLGKGVTSLGERCFYRCKKLKNIDFGSAPAAIGEEAFSECSELESVVIPDTIVSIGTKAFANCAVLTSVTIGSGAQSIGYSLFKDCPEMSQITVSLENPVYSSGGEGNNIIFDKTTGEIMAAIKTSKIPEGVTAIGDEAFVGWVGEELVIPGSVKTIGAGAFSDAVMTSLVIEDGVQKIGDRAFYGCTGIQEVTLPDSVTELGQMAFDYCTGLQKVTLDSNLNTVEYDAFANCSSLTEVVIPDGVETLEEGAFHNCPAMKEIAIPASVTRIDLLAVGYYHVIGNEESELDPDDYDCQIPEFNILGVENSSAWLYAVRNHLLFNGEKLNSITYYFDEIDEIPDQIYTGGAIRPDVELLEVDFEEHGVAAADALAEDIDYSVTYKNNTKVGEATVVVKGIGDYTGNMQKKFRICFTDVPSNHSFAKAIYWANSEHIVSGYKDGSFKPGQTVTRGDFVMMLWKAAGRPEPNKTTQTFSDVPVTSNYYKPVQWAAENKITTGYTKGAKKGSFGVKDSVTRGQLMMFLWRYAGKPEPAAAGAYYADVPETHSYFKAVQWATQSRISSGGVSENIFGVGRTCTRAHCAKFIYKQFG